MTREEKYKIISNDYAEILIKYRENETIPVEFETETFQVINATHAVIYVPVGQISSRSISQIGYSFIPSVFGLISAKSLEASQITKLRNVPNFSLRGRGVLIGLLDTGIDYTNKIFQNDDNTTRIVSIWDQSIDSEDKYPDDIFYGTEYSREQINQALKSENPYDIVPSKDEDGHGTMMAGIAAGSEIEAEGFSGVASDAELVVVKMKTAKTYLREFFSIPEEAVCYQENDILFALRYLADTARKRNQPMVICIGFGTSQSGHDGAGAVSRYASSIADTPGMAVVIGVGNEGNGKRHFFATMESSLAYETVELNVGENEIGFAMELWGDSPNIFSVDILSPTGEYIPRIAPRLTESREISFVFEKTYIFVDYQVVEAETGDEIILFRFINPTPGIWRFRVYGRGELEKSFHIWLPMEHFISENTYFVNSDPETTTLSPGNAPVPLMVTAYNPENDSLYLRASIGYARNNMVTPQIAAPGVNVVGPTLDQKFAEFNGSSVATAHTSGVVAMILEWAIVNDNYNNIDTKEIKNLILRGAKRNPTITYPNKEWGYGILDVYNVFNIIRSDIVSSDIAKSEI